ncbi:hypothetical protein ID855_22095, partial [Xenorhabdus sp. ZM]|uniref:hypothetical protein n=1 Tax=Xenorhabdus szentirmaii TaxID=290112 RepID=UPI00198E9201
FTNVERIDMTALRVIKNIDKEKWVRETVKKSLSQIAELNGMDYLLGLVKELAEEGIEEGANDEKYQSELEEMRKVKEYKMALDRLSSNLVDIRLADKNEGKTFDAIKEENPTVATSEEIEKID